MISCYDLVNAAVESFREQVSVRPAGNECVVVLPYLTSEASQVEIWVSERDGEFALTDDGVTIGQLYLSGVTVEGSRKLEGIVEHLCELYGTSFSVSSITTRASAASIGEALLRLANTVVAVSQLDTHRNFRARPNFTAEVKQLLATNKVTYDADFALPGRTGPQAVSIYVNSNINVLLEPLSASSISRARELSRLTAYKWIDLKYLYQDEYKYDVVVNDSTPELSTIWDDPSVIEPLRIHSTNVFRWSLDQGMLISQLSDRE